MKTAFNYLVRHQSYMYIVQYYIISLSPLLTKNVVHGCVLISKYIIPIPIPSVHMSIYVKLKGWTTLF